MRAPALVAAALALLASSTAWAVVDCSVATTGVAFGTYDPGLAIDTDSAGNLTVRCVHVSGGASRITYTVALSAGSSGSYASRQMRSGGSPLLYNLFSDGARTQVWGNGTAGTVTASGTFTVGPGVGNGTREVLHTLYGRIPALQPVATGAYLDTIVVTLTF